MKITMQIEYEGESFEDFTAKMQSKLKATIEKPSNGLTVLKQKLDSSRIPKRSKLNWDTYMPEGQTCRDVVYEHIKLGKEKEFIKNLLVGYVHDKRPDLPISFLVKRAISMYYNVKAVMHKRPSQLENNSAPLAEVAEEEEIEDDGTSDLAGSVD